LPINWGEGVEGEEVRKGGWKFKNMIDKGRKKLLLLPSQFGK